MLVKFCLNGYNFLHNFSQRKIKSFWPYWKNRIQSCCHEVRMDVWSLLVRRWCYLIALTFVEAYEKQIWGFGQNFKTVQFCYFLRPNVLDTHLYYASNQTCFSDILQRHGFILEYTELLKRLHGYIRICHISPPS